MKPEYKRDVQSFTLNASYRKPLEGKHWTVKRIVFIFRPLLLACVNYGEYWIWSFNITVLNKPRHFYKVCRTVYDWNIAEGA